MADNGLIVRDSSGNPVTLNSKDIGAGVQAMNHIITDGTTLCTMKAANTKAVPSTDTALVVAPLPMSNGTQVMPVGDAYARAIFFSQAAEAVKAGATAAANSVLQGAEFLANASLLALTTGQQGPLQCDPAGNLKVGEVPLGVPIYGTASSGGAASAAVTLTIPSAKMGYLDGIDLDGTGATAGSAVSMTIAGVLGGTLTYLVGVPAGATVPFSRSFRFKPPLQASATNTNIVVTLASLGSGNLASTNNCYGHYV